MPFQSSFTPNQNCQKIDYLETIHSDEQHLPSPKEVAKRLQLTNEQRERHRPWMLSREAYRAAVAIKKPWLKLPALTSCSSRPLLRGSPLDPVVEDFGQRIPIHRCGG